MTSRNQLNNVVIIETISILDLMAIIWNSLSEKKWPKNSELFYIDKRLPWFGSFLIRCLKIQQLNFKLDEIRDEKNTTIGWQIIYRDLQNVLDLISKGSEYRKLFNQSAFNNQYFFLYLKKWIASVMNQVEFSSLWKTLFIINVCKVKFENEDNNDSKKSILMDYRPWMESIVEYANQFGLDIKVKKKKVIWKEIIKQMVYRWPGKTENIIKTFNWRPKNAYCTINSNSNSNRYKIAVESMGSFNIDQKHLFSDFAYYHQSDLCAENLLPYLSDHPLKKEQYKELIGNKLDSIALKSRAIKGFDIPVFSTNINLKYKLPRLIKDSSNKMESKELRLQVNKYNYLKNYWYQFFDQSNSKVHVTQYRWDNSHIPKADAMYELGGISSVWQMSYYDTPSPFLSVAADILFSFSPLTVKQERLNGSRIQYQVSVGYPGDYRFSLLAPMAEKIKSKLRSNGAKTIIAFFDENSSTDERWTIGNSLVCEEYSFYLNKLLENPWLGVVFKPKKPHTLRKRLKPIDNLVEEALETGRCHFFMAESSGIPPAIAALSADLAIHGTIWAATAGVESALCGVPTLLMDQDNWHYSHLNALGKNEVVFHNWDDLWCAISDFSKNKEGNQRIGNWDALLVQLDPFRDGRAMERIGNFLNWLIDGFEQGLGKDDVLCGAVDRYGKQWGHDNIVQVKNQ